MEAFLKAAERLGGFEVLHFEDAEIEKSRGDQKIFGAFGPLNVLWFKEFNRYILQLNDWRYPLLRRLPVRSSDQIEGGRTYTLEGLNGTKYRLRVNNANANGLGNLDSIFKNMSNYSAEGSDEIRKIEASPDDKVHRSVRKQSATVEFINDVVKGVGNKVNQAKTYFTGKNSKKKVLNTDIKNRDWKSEAKSSFPKEFFTNTDKLSKEFSNLRQNNSFNTESRTWEELRKIAHLPLFYIPRREIEAAILNAKDIVTQGNFGADVEPKKTILGSLRSGVQNVGRTMTNGINNLIHPNPSTASTENSELRGRTRSVDQPTMSGIDRLPVSEGLTHLQG